MCARAHPVPPPSASRARRGERGIALLITLLLLLILVPFAYEFSSQVGLEVRTAQNVADQLMLENAIDGQFEIVLARLEQDLSDDDVDQLHDTWNDKEIQERKDDSGVSLSTRVFDEQGKFNVLLLTRAPQERRQVMKDRMVRILVEARKDSKEPIDESLAKELVDDVTAFLAGTKPRGTIPKPSTPDNRGMLTLDDLTFTNPKWANLLVDQRAADRVAPGLQRYLTIYGTGKVNLNTADPVVLRAFFPSDPGIADRIVSHREGEDDQSKTSTGTSGSGTGTGTGSGSGTSGTSGSSGTSGTGSSSSSSSSKDTTAQNQGNPFTDVNQVNQIEGVDPTLLQKDKVDLAADFDVKSQFFSIRVLAESKSTRRDELYVVERVKAQTQGAQQGASKLEGFRHHLHQERTDAFEDLATKD